MDHSLRICLVHAPGPVASALRSLGHEVLTLAPQGGGLLNLPAELRLHGFAPQLVLQCERLGPRLLLAGLEDLDATRVFWAFDPHLNAFWQAPYARLFDLVLSTQRAWVPHLQALGAARVRHMPWLAPQEPFVPHGQRPRLSGFVGRLGSTRPVRTWLSELMAALLPQDFELKDGLDLDGMYAFYRATRLVPNESITGEVNLRLFEAAGCGCVVLAQDLGQEQAELFEPGREMLVCADALELAENLQLLAKRPRLAEAMGRAAWERAQRDHSPQARVLGILREADAAPRQGATAHHARFWLALAQAGLCEAGRLPGAQEALAAELAALQPLDAPSPNPVLLSARLRLGHALGREAETAELLALVRSLPPAWAVADLVLALTCSAMALGLGRPPGAPCDLPLAQAFAQQAGVPLPECGATASTLLLAWAQTLDAAGVLPRGGFSFDAAAHLPATAAECLHCALCLEPGHEEVLRASIKHLARCEGSSAHRLGLLSELGLRAPADWRVGLELGLCNLRTFRPGPGLSELDLAARTAAAQGQSEAFAQALLQADPAGRLRRALNAAP